MLKLASVRSGAVAITLGSAIALAVPMGSVKGGGGGERLHLKARHLGRAVQGVAGRAGRDYVWRPIGTFSVSAYCACAKCCGKWHRPGQTFADGTLVSEVRDQERVSRIPMPRIVAATKSISFGSLLFIDGVGLCVCKDRGGAIGEGKADLFFSQAEGGHEAALQWGRKTLRCWIWKE